MTDQRLPQQLLKGRHIARPQAGETVPCGLCDEPTTYTGTRRCSNCYEVESRLHVFLRSEKGRGVVKQHLQSQRLIADSAEVQALVDDVDELERYTKELELARDTIATAELNKLLGWVQEDKLEFAKRWIRSGLGINKMTLAQLHDAFSVYFPEV